jgi:hypothetical protein
VSETIGIGVVLTTDYVVQSVIVMGPLEDRKCIIDHLKGSMLPSESSRTVTPEAANASVSPQVRLERVRKGAAAC